jgi:hypothetical protein
MMPALLPLTRENITQDDLDLINMLRQGLIPDSAIPLEKQVSRAEMLADKLTSILPSWYGKKSLEELTYEEARRWFEILFQLSMSAKRLQQHIADTGNLRYNQDRKLAIAKANDDKAKHLVSNATQEPIEKRGRKASSPLEKLVRSLLNSKLPEAALRATVLASFPGTSQDEITQAMSDMKGYRTIIANGKPISFTPAWIKEQGLGPSEIEALESGKPILFKDLTLTLLR